MARPQHISDDTIITGLAAAGEVTTTDLADRLGIGQSTAAKRLAALEGTGSVLRQPGGRVNGIRVADRWSAIAGPADQAEKPDPKAAHATASTDGDGPTGTTGDEPSQAERAAEAGGDRLERGALGALVREYLAARPDEDLGPSQVGKALGRSQGAVSNLCGSSLSSATVDEVADAVGISVSEASKALASLAREGLVSRSPGGREGGRRLPDRWSVVAAEDPAVSGVRLGRGQLRELVVEHLRGHPGEVSPAQLSKVLEHSAGAISNALVKLVDAGEVVQTSDHPRRYAAR
jgi:predicted transcriptional regulator